MPRKRGAGLGLPWSVDVNQRLSSILWKVEFMVPNSQVHSAWFSPEARGNNLFLFYLDLQLCHHLLLFQEYSHTIFFILTLSWPTGELLQMISHA